MRHRLFVITILNQNTSQKKPTIKNKMRRKRIPLLQKTKSLKYRRKVKRIRVARRMLRRRLGKMPLKSLRRRLKFRLPVQQTIIINKQIIKIILIKI